MFGFLKRRKKNEDAECLKHSIEELKQELKQEFQRIFAKSRLLESEISDKIESTLAGESKATDSWPESFKKHAHLCRQELACASPEDNPRFWKTEISCAERAYELWSMHFNAVQKRILLEIACALEIEFPKNGLSDTLKQGAIGRASPQSILEW